MAVCLQGCLSLYVALTQAGCRWNPFCISRLWGKEEAGRGPRWVQGSQLSLTKMRPSRSAVGQPGGESDAVLTPISLSIWGRSGVGFSDTVEFETGLLCGYGLTEPALSIYFLWLERSPCHRLSWPIPIKADFCKEGSKLPHLINGHVLPASFRMSTGLYPGMLCMCLHLPMNSWEPLETLGQNSLETVFVPSGWSEHT